MEEEQISNGIHTLSGISDLIIKANNFGYNNNAYCLWEDANGFVIELDNKTYVVFEDPEDGYRSCGKICEAKDGEVCTNTFPEQKVLVKYFEGVHSNGWYSPHVWYYEFLNPETNELILKIGTEDYDDYYPRSILEYYPENLPINKNK